MSTLILTVDLECRRCYKKIRKVIAKCPEIESQIFDEKNNKVFVSGHFDPEKLKRKLCCKACKYIKDIQIKPPPEPPKPTPPPPEPVKPPKPASPKPVEPTKPTPPPSEPEIPPPKPPPPPPPPEPVLPVPGIPVGPYAPMVCCRPCYEGHPEHGICTHFGYERGTCRCNYKFFSEEDPSCSIM